MDRKTILAILISFGIFLAWQEFVLKKYQQSPQQSEAPTLTTKPVEKKTEGASVPATTVSRETKTLSLSQGELVIGNGAKAIESWTFKTHQEEIRSEQIVSDLPQVDLTVDHADYGFLSTATGPLRSQSESQWQWSFQNDLIEMSRELEVNAEKGYADIAWKIRFKGARPKVAFVSLVAPLQAGKGEPADRKIVYMAGKRVETTAAAESAKLTDVLVRAPWVGIEDRYFLLGLVDRSGMSRALVQPLAEKGNRISLTYPIEGESTVIPVRVYFGPKQSGLLKNVSPELVNAIDFGWLTFFAHLILDFMNWLFSFLKNYGLAIIVLTTVIKILLYPLTYKSMKSMKQMATLQPQLQKLRERYANDKEALNREMLSLMRNHGYNPMAGCLPMLIQMPVFFALYRVLYGSFELYRAPFGLWIMDLSAKDPWYVTPVLLTAVMFFQQKLTPTTTTDPTQAKMMQWMPVIFGVFMLGLPAGLTLYMLTNAVVSIVQQVILNKKLGIVSPQEPKRAAVESR